MGSDAPVESCTAWWQLATHLQVFLIPNQFTLRCQMSNLHVNSEWQIKSIWDHSWPPRYIVLYSWKNCYCLFRFYYWILTFVMIWYICRCHEVPNQKCDIFKFFYFAFINFSLYFWLLYNVLIDYSSNNGYVWK